MTVTWKDALLNRNYAKILMSVNHLHGVMTVCLCIFPAFFVYLVHHHYCELCLISLFTVCVYAEYQSYN